MLYRLLLVFTFRVTCVLDKCTLEYKLYSCVYIRTCTKGVLVKIDTVSMCQ
jgi:hypothetical protein